MGNASGREKPYRKEDWMLHRDSEKKGDDTNIPKAHTRPGSYFMLFHKLEVTRRTRTTIIALLLTILFYTCSMVVLFMVGAPGYIGVAALAGMPILILIGKLIFDRIYYSNYRHLYDLAEFDVDKEKYSNETLTRMYNNIATTIPAQFAKQIAAWRVKWPSKHIRESRKEQD